MRELSFKFLNRAVPVFPVHNEMITLTERRYVKVEALFLNEIPGRGIMTLLGLNTYDTLNMKVTSERYKAFSEATNDSTQVTV